MTDRAAVLREREKFIEAARWMWEDINAGYFKWDESVAKIAATNAAQRRFPLPPKVVPREVEYKSQWGSIWSVRVVDGKVQHRLEGNGWYLSHDQHYSKALIDLGRLGLTVEEVPDEGDGA